MTAIIATRLQVMWNRLLAIVEEQGQTLIRAAFSPIVRECGDISAGIFDLQGRMLAQAVTGTPGHINTMAEAVKTLRDRFPLQEMKPGDIYVTNDPWIASGHLNDFLLLMPAFRKGQVVGFTSCTSHLVDLGGLGMGPEGSDIYDEGLLVPPCKLVDRGEVNGLLLDIIKANSREAIDNEGDIFALIAACEMGAGRLVAMMDEFGLDHLDPLATHIIETSRRGTLAAIAELPRGTYRSSLLIDGYESEIELHARLTVSGDGIALDFAGTSGCSMKGINVPLNYATAYSVFGLRCIFAPEVPNNAGSLEPFQIDAPPDCIVNAPRPVPVAQRHIIGQLLPDVVLGCLRQAMPKQIPAEGSSCMYDLPMRGGFDATSSKNATRFAVELTHNGGTGARPCKDGLSVTAFPSGVYGSQVEVTESTSPLLVRRRELRPDSGGAGKHRGGLGQVIEIENREQLPFDFFGTVDRVKYPARGCFGGHDGACGHLALKSGRLINGKGKQKIPAGETLVFQTPGGGGYGDPRTRAPTLVAQDYAAGLISRTAVKRHYGVVLDRNGNVDTKATRALRKQ